MKRKVMWAEVVAMGTLLWCIGLSVETSAQSPGGANAVESQSPKAANESRMSRLVQRLEEAENRSWEIQQRIQHGTDRIDEIGEILNGANVSEESYPEVLMQLQLQRINLSIEKAGLDAKVDKLMDVVKVKGNESDAKVEAKRAKLQELLTLETLSLKRVEELRKEGLAPDSDASELRKRVIQVEVQLMDLETPSRNVSPDSVWATDSLSKIALDQIEVAAKLSAINELLASLQPTRSRVNELKSLHRELDILRDEGAQVRSETSQLQSRLAELQEMGE
jgi:chromosome segregation ATPase